MKTNSTAAASVGWPHQLGFRQQVRVHVDLKLQTLRARHLLDGDRRSFGPIVHVDDVRTARRRVGLRVRLGRLIFSLLARRTDLDLDRQLPRTVRRVRDRHRGVEHRADRLLVLVGVEGEGQPAVEEAEGRLNRRRKTRIFPCSSRA